MVKSVSEDSNKDSILKEINVKLTALPQGVDHDYVVPFFIYLVRDRRPPRCHMSLRLHESVGRQKQKARSFVRQNSSSQYHFIWEQHAHRVRVR